MLGVHKRRQVKALLGERHSLTAIARLAEVSLSSVKRIAKEADVYHLDDAAERKRRGIGRPSKVRPFRNEIVEILRREPQAKPVEVLNQLRASGYDGGKTAFYTFITALRSELDVAETPTAVSSATTETHVGSVGGSAYGALRR